MNKALFTLTLFFVTLFQSSSIAQTNEPKLVFEYISYEYGEPLQKEYGFDIRRSYQLYDNRDMIIIDRYPGVYETMKITLDKDIYDKIMNLPDDISSLRIKEKLDEGHSYGGAYDYISITRAGNKQSLAFIELLTADQLNEVIDDLYNIDLEKVEKTTNPKETEKILSFALDIVLVHIKSNLPLIEQHYIK